MSGDIFDTRFEGKAVELKDNRVQIGDDVNILANDPALNEIMIGVGWDSNMYAGEIVDVDISVFLLNKDDMTRKNDDFVYYNNMNACDGALRHEGDNRTGAGDGDDETILINLNGIPFDILRIVFVCSIYKGGEKDQGLGLIKNSYIRVVNCNNEHEILRFDLDAHLKDADASAAIVGSLNREGSKWHFVPLMEFYPKGLGEIATKYGMSIIQQ